MPREVDPGTIKKGSGMANQDSVDSNSFTNEVIEGQTHGLDALIHDPQGAFDASAIATTGSGGVYYGNDVQENLDELSALVPPKPPTIGNFSLLTSNTGITDWGRLKLNDGGFIARGEVTPPSTTAPNQDYWVYSEWLFPPWVAQEDFSTFFGFSNPRGAPFTVDGNDPATDPTFNVVDGGYPGGGPGVVHQGGFLRTAPIIETSRIKAVGDDEVVISGAVYPADRGIIALFHWPPGGDEADFLAQPLTTRVVAAILCGQGLNGECDGDPGGMFDEGSPDAFAFPGRASGQYDLVELHLGVDAQTGDPIPGGPEPGTGQVRLGTDPNAGPVVAGGIPILGGTTAGTGSGNDDNFFRYRLPYLNDYSTATGIEFTPAVQKPRYFTKPAVSLDPGTDLTQAGDFANFTKDYWTFQLARYRHTFDQGAAVDKGSHILLHFETEADFEAFARDGVMPDDISFGYPLWSADMVTYVNPESTDNLVDNLSDPGNPQTSTAYHLHRSAVFDDAQDATVDLGRTFTYDREVDEVMFVSGVQHFLPNGTGLSTNWNIDTLTWSVTGAFANSFRLGRDHSLPDITDGLWHSWPGILFLGIATADYNVVNGLGAGFTGAAFYQRVQFDYVDFDSVSGPWDLTTGPTTIDSADVILLGGDTPITFAGDDTQCHFWHDARLRFFLRRPLDQQSATPTAAEEFLFPNPGAAERILIHSTSQAPSTVSAGIYGNFKTTDPGDFPPRATVEDPRKDVEERFYDEVYRYADSGMVSIDPSYNGILGVGNLVGPGLPFGAFGAIEMPVRVASEALVGFGAASWLRTDLHLLDLASAAAVSTEAQVSGLPDRNPPASDGVANPCPFSGMLIYPQFDYTTGFRPSVGAGDTTNPQFDYSVVADPERVYLRVFDAAYSNQPSDPQKEPTVVGQPFLTFRVEGLALEDFAFSGFGPGSDFIAIEVKVPGLTTWMDLGRPDMAGPSKQDPLTDGAGCQTIDPTVTFDSRDAVTGTVFAQVRVNVGPAVNLFANPGLLAPAGVAPVLVRVRIKAAGIAFNLTQGGSDTPSDIVRALTGITLLRHSNGLGPNDAAPYGPYPATP